MHSTRRKHRNLEFGANRWSAPRFGANRRHQINIGGNVTFSLAWESLDSPNDCLLLRFILGSSEGMLNLRLGRILGHWNLDDHMCRKELI